MAICRHIWTMSTWPFHHENISWVFVISLAWKIWLWFRLQVFICPSLCVNTQFVNWHTHKQERVEKFDPVNAREVTNTLFVIMHILTLPRDIVQHKNGRIIFIAYSKCVLDWFNYWEINSFLQMLLPHEKRNYQQ